MNKKVLMVLSCVILITLGVLIYNNTKASGNDPGTVQDPLVTKSYVDELINNTLEEVDTKLAQFEGAGNNTTDTPVNMTDIYNYIDNKFSQNNASQGLGFAVIKVETGQKLICEESTELIVRSGNAVAIANAAGDGISDVTAGTDIKTNEQVPLNHLIIIPRTDGRGISIKFQAYVMIKGKYTIQ